MTDQNPYQPPDSVVHKTGDLATKSGRRTFLFFCGGLGATLHWVLLGIGVASGFLISTEELAEFVIIATVLLTPMLLMPTWLALYQLYRRPAPRLSKALLATGMAGFSAFLILPVLFLLSDQRLEPFLPLLWLLLLGNGLWLVLAGFIGLRTQTAPGNLMAIAQTVAGLAWMALAVGLILLSIPGLAGQMALLPFFSLCVFVLAQLVWSSLLGVWLLRNAASITLVEQMTKS